MWLSVNKNLQIESIQNRGSTKFLASSLIILLTYTLRRSWSSWWGRAHVSFCHLLHNIHIIAVRTFIKYYKISKLDLLTIKFANCLNIMFVVETSNTIQVSMQQNDTGVQDLEVTTNTLQSSIYVLSWTTYVNTQMLR